jgi:Zn-dependent peptidase ImmA (M78 family)/transcriptional regulator with XRE-family HTH domain
MGNPVNPNMVVLARELAGLTQGELAKAVSISQGKQSKIEAGIFTMTDDLLAKTAHALRRPETFFRQPERLYGVETSLMYHRKRESVAARTLRWMHAIVNLRRIHIARLMEGAAVQSQFDIPALDIEEFDGRADHVAKAVRLAWMLPRGPIDDLASSIENAGGIIIRFDFGTRLIDGLSQRIPGLPPLFFLNSEMPADRERLTLAHELGHVVMHAVPNPDIEEQANLFAAHFLMPDEDIRHAFNIVTLARLAALKGQWKVSMGALLVKARHLGKVTSNQYEYLWKQMSAAGYRTREPEHLDFPPEEPRLLQEAIAFHRGPLDYDVKQLASLLNADEQEVRSMYLGQHLRAV